MLSLVACLTLLSAPQEITYKTEPRDLVYFMYAAESSDEPNAAVVFFHGGGWVGGKPGQFRMHAEHLAKAGVTSFLVEYRLRSTDNTPATDCVVDAWDAWSHIVERADEYNIDASRIAVGGGSAGGHIAACLGTGTFPPGYEARPEVRPAAMVLFNPGLCIAEFEGYEPPGFEAASEQKVGCDPKLLSPMHHLDKNTPATFIVHGTADTTISIRSPALFVERLQQYGTTAELKRYPGEKHGFFNAKRGGSNENYERTRDQMTTFLAENGFLTKRDLSSE